MKFRGFTLLEVTLAIVVGLVILSGALAAFKQYRDGARINQAKLQLATLKQNIAMARYRTGTFPILGAVAAANLSGTSLTVPATAVIPNGTALRLIGAGGAATASVQSGGGTTNLVLAAVTSLANGAVTVCAGVAGNVDDQFNKYLPVPDPSPAISGMGIGDPWTGFQSVRPMVGATVPARNVNGYQYVSGDPDDVWGGVAYDVNTGNAEYVLPDPASLTAPPAPIGYFPGDPPVNWGK